MASVLRQQAKDGVQIVVFSDALYFKGEYEDAMKAALDRARAAGIQLHAYLLPLVGSGREEWLTEAIQSSGGVVTVVRSSAKLPQAVSQFSASSNQDSAEGVKSGRFRGAAGELRVIGILGCESARRVSVWRVGARDRTTHSGVSAWRGGSALVLDPRWEGTPFAIGQAWVLDLETERNFLAACRVRGSHFRCLGGYGWPTKPRMTHRSAQTMHDQSAITSDALPSECQ